MKHIALLSILLYTVSVSQIQQRLTKVESNFSAEELYAKGRDLFTQAATAKDAKTRADNLKKAVKYFEETTSKDSTYLSAYLALLQCYTSMSGFGTVSSSELSAKTKAVAARATQLNDSLAEPHQMLGWVKYQYDWDWDGAGKEFRRALELNPEFTELWPRFASFLASQGKTKEALLEVQRLARFSNDKGWANFSLGYICFWSRQYDDAITYYKKAIEAHPNIWQYHFNIGLTYTQKSQYEDAADELRKAVVLSGRNPTAISGLGYSYALVGKKHDALTMIEETEKNWRQANAVSLVPAYRVAAIYAALGDKESALDWLERGWETKSPWMVWLKVDPSFDILQKDTRYIALLRDIGLWK